MNRRLGVKGIDILFLLHGRRYLTMFQIYASTYNFYTSELVFTIVTKRTEFEGGRSGPRGLRDIRPVRHEFFWGLRVRRHGRCKVSSYPLLVLD